VVSRTGGGTMVPVLLLQPPNIYNYLPINYYDLLTQNYENTNKVNGNWKKK